MGARDREHIIVTGWSRPEPYRPPRLAFKPPVPPTPRDPARHAGRIHRAIDDALKASSARRTAARIVVAGSTPGDQERRTCVTTSEPHATVLRQALTMAADFHDEIATKVAWPGCVPR